MWQHVQQPIYYILYDTLGYYDSCSLLTSNWITLRVRNGMHTNVDISFLRLASYLYDLAHPLVKSCLFESQYFELFPRATSTISLSYSAREILCIPCSTRWIPHFPCFASGSLFFLYDHEANPYPLHPANKSVSFMLHDANPMHDSPLPSMWFLARLTRSHF